MLIKFYVAPTWVHHFCPEIWCYDNFCALGLKVAYKPRCFENNATRMLCTLKESWNHLEINFESKNYDFCQKNSSKEDFIGFQPKNEMDQISSLSNFQNIYK